MLGLLESSDDLGGRGVFAEVAQEQARLQRRGRGLPAAGGPGAPPWGGRALRAGGQGLQQGVRPVLQLGQSIHFKR